MSMRGIDFEDTRPGPVYDLPPEILEEIFLNCLPPYTTFSAKEAPLLLCSVSSAWRAVALRFPHLWSYVSINISDLITKSHKTSRQPDTLSVSDFLKRSKDVPLSIRLAARFPELLDHPDWVTQLHRVVIQCHHRIQNLELSSSWFSHFAYSIPTKAHFPMLRNITVTSFSGPSFDSLSTPFTSFYDAKLLQQVTYNAYISHETALNLSIPWEQLSHLTLSDVDCTAWDTIFRRCINLRFGSFVVSGSAHPLPKSDSHTVFPFLTRLSLNNAQSSPESQLRLQGYSFPNLEELHLVWNDSPGFDTNFLSSVRCLRKLAISNPPNHIVSAQEILNILALAPTISELRLSSDHCVVDILEALTYQSHQRFPLLPQLRTLIVDSSIWSTLYDQAPMLSSLKKMVGSRCWVYPNSTVRRLESLKLAVATPEMDNVQEAMKRFTDAGLALILRATP